LLEVVEEVEEEAGKLEETVDIPLEAQEPMEV